MGDWPYTFRHHWIVLLRPPGRYVWIVFGLLLLFVLVGGWPALIPLLVVLAVFFGFRYQEWRAERIELSPRTIRYARGVKETTETSAFIRVDRISGVAMSQTVTGKLLGYGTVHIEVSGHHPDFRRIVNIENPKQTFALLEGLMFKDTRSDADPDDVGFDTSYVDTSYVDTSYVDTSYVDTSYVDTRHVDNSYVDTRPTAPLPVVPEEPETAPRIYKWRP